MTHTQSQRTCDTSSLSVHLELQPLESRDAPAVFTATDGYLRVTGTDGADTISLRVEDGRLSVMFGESPDTIRVHTRSGRVVERTAIALVSIRSLSVDGRGGDDAINMSNSPVRVFISGGAGQDRLTGSRFDDVIATGDGEFNTVLGRGGDDLIVGGSGVDFLFGEAGNDSLFGEGGNDVLLGGDGDDRLYGRAGDDWLDGQRGNDILHGGHGADRLRGGVGDSDAADAFYGIDIVSGIENSTEGGSPLVVNGAVETDIRQNERPYCVFYSHLAGMARIYAARGRNLAAERIEFVGRDVAGNFLYNVHLFTSSGAPVTRRVIYNGPSAGDATPVEGEAWVTIFEKAFMDQIHAEDPTGSLWRRYWDHQTVMTMLTGGCEQVHMINHFDATFGATLGDEHFSNIAAAIRAGRLVTASTWNTPLRGVSTNLVIREHNYTVVSVNEAARTITIRNPWGIDGGSGSGDPNDGLITISWADFKGSFQGYNVGVIR